jgi:23S rRNA pseudouridine2605 synthase
MQLTKYLSNSGLATRREASQLIKDGKISVNDVVCLEPFYVVLDTDIVTHKGKTVTLKTEYVYFLVNKPKDVATNPPEGKVNIGTLVSKKTSLAVTTTDDMTIDDLGLAILTNDKTLIDRLSANRKVKYTYQVFLEKPWSDKTKLKTKENWVIIEVGIIPDHFVQIETTLTLAELKDLLTTAKVTFNKIDRLAFGSITKKDLPRGWNRPLTEKEIIFLKHFS